MLGPLSSKSSRPTPLERRFAQATFAVVVGILVVELVLRIVIGLGDPPLYEAHPRIEYVMKSGVYRRFGNTVTVNSFGMRSPESAVRPLSEGERRVLVIGDSIVNGGSLTDDIELSTSQLSARLSETGPTTVCNISAGSWGPGNWLAFLREHGTFGAGFAVLVLNDGDATDVPTFQPLGPEHPTHRPPLAAWEAMFTYLPRFLPFMRAKPGERGITPIRYDDPLVELDRCVELLRGAEISVCAVLFPSEAEVIKNPGHGLNEIQDRLEAQGVPCVRANGRLRDAMTRGTEPFRDGVHPSIVGQTLLMECYLEALSRIGFRTEAEPSTRP